MVDLVQKVDELLGEYHKQIREGVTKVVTFEKVRGKYYYRTELYNRSDGGLTVDHGPLQPIFDTAACFRTIKLHMEQGFERPGKKNNWFLKFIKEAIDLCNSKS